ncbi:hypothetical protein [Pseudoxanthomonas mexicana]
MSEIPQHDIDAVEAISDREPLSTKQAAILTGYSERTLERRRVAGVPPHPLERKREGGDWFYTKQELLLWRNPKVFRRAMHSYQVEGGVVVGHCDWNAPNAEIGTIQDMLELEWADSSLMRQALVILQNDQKEELAAFRADQEEQMANAFRRVTELEKRQLKQAVGDAGKPRKPGDI